MNLGRLSEQEQSASRSKASAHLLNKTGGAALFLSGILSILYLRPTALATITGLIGAMLYGTGFCLLAWPVLLRAGRTLYGKLGLALLHAIVLVFAGILAKYLVADALGLPSGDFPATIAMLTLIAYPAVWLVNVTLVGLLYCLALFAISYLALLSTFPVLDDALRLFARLFHKNSRPREFFEDGRKVLSSRSGEHGIGIIVVSVFSLIAAAMWIDAIHQPHAVRLFAFIADYERAPTYPGVDSGAFKLHDNGVVSYATYSQGDVAIRVDRVRSPT